MQTSNNIDPTIQVFDPTRKDIDPSTLVKMLGRVRSKEREFGKKVRSVYGAQFRSA